MNKNNMAGIVCMFTYKYTLSVTTKCPGTMFQAMFQVLGMAKRTLYALVALPFY